MVSTLAAVCDTDADRARRAGERTRRAAWFRTIDDMVKASAKDVPIDLVTICTPSGIHAAQGVGRGARR